MTLQSAPRFQARRDALEREGAAAWARADLAMALLALMPDRLKGIVVEGAAPEVAGALQDLLTRRMPAPAQTHRMPVSITDDRLIGGLDLAATLTMGRPVAEPGLLVRADGGVLVVPMAERLNGRAAAQLARALDIGEVLTERDGLSFRKRTAFVMLAISDPDERGEELPSGLSDRIAFAVSLCSISPARLLPAAFTPEAVEAARQRMGQVSVQDDVIEALIAAALQLGIGSIRAPGFCLAAARGIAALSGRDEVSEADARMAAELVYASRAQRLPAAESAPPPDPDEQEDNANVPNPVPDALTEILVEAVSVRVSLDLAARDRSRKPAPRQEPASGKSGDRFESGTRGSRVSSRPGNPRRQGTLDLLATFRAAAPWQTIRTRTSPDVAIAVRSEDFRLKRFSRRSEAVVIFAVDASGSAAMHRLSEAKGAVELLLSGCYARRESVALIAFRKEGADMLLPPTRSLTRVKRSLSRLPGGGGTPLAAGIAAAARLAQIERRRRRAPYIVILSDGQGNIALDGSTGRERAAEDARDMARRMKALAEPVLFFDISRRPSPEAQAISQEMGALYRPLPVADARRVSDSVRSLLLS